MADGQRLAPTPKQPPHSMEAEQSVLGGLLLNNRAWIDLGDQLVEEDFYTNDHRVIFSAIADLLSRNRPCDFVTLSEHLRQAGKLEEAGGISYLGTLAADTPSAANVRAYAEIVRERSVLRCLIAAGQDIAELGYEPGGRARGELMDTAEQALSGIRSRDKRSSGTGKSFAELMETFENRLDSIRANGPQQGLPTGYTQLDKLTTGLYPGDLVILGGRPGQGKTSLAMNIAEHVAVERKQPVQFFSMEMSADQLMQRCVSSFGRIDLQKLRNGELDDYDWGRVVSAGGALRQAPITIDDAGALSPLELRARARRAQAKHGTKLIIVDYIQLMQVPGNRDNRTNEISAISRNLKSLAKELQVPIIAISQLSRKCEERTNKRPLMSDLRESGSIEQDADLILFVYRDEYYHPDSQAKGTAEIIIAKQRSGPTDTVRTAFVGAYSRFDNLAPDFAYQYYEVQQPPRRQRGFDVGTTYRQPHGDDE